MSGAPAKSRKVMETTDSEVEALDVGLVAELVAGYCDPSTIRNLANCSKVTSHRLSSCPQVWRHACEFFAGTTLDNIGPAKDWKEACQLLVAGRLDFPSFPSDRTFVAGEWRVWTSPAPKRSTFVGNEQITIEFPWDSIGYFRVVAAHSRASWTVWCPGTATRDEKAFRLPPAPEAASAVIAAEAEIKSGWVSSKIGVSGGAITVRLPTGSRIEFPAALGSRPVLRNAGTTCPGTEVTALCEGSASVMLQHTPAVVWRSTVTPIRKVAKLLKFAL